MLCACPTDIYRSMSAIKLKATSKTALKAEKSHTWRGYEESRNNFLTSLSSALFHVKDLWADYMYLNIRPFKNKDISKGSWDRYLLLTLTRLLYANMALTFPRLVGFNYSFLNMLYLWKNVVDPSRVIPQEKITWLDPISWSLSYQTSK